MEVTAWIVVVATLMSSWFAISEAKKFTNRGTLRDLREIVIGRCIEYQNGLVFLDSDIEELRSKNCTKIWEKFFKSFAYRDPCDVSLKHYEEFLQASKTTIPRNKAIYWDGWDIYQIVTNYANKGKRLVTLETTLPGYLGSGISFCGSKTDPTGLEFGNCPAEGECGFGKGAVDAFWSRLSTYFGAESAGDIKVVFNSNRPGGAFHEKGSFFFEFEVLNLNATQINHMDIFVVTELNKTSGDSCRSPSLVRLGNILDELKIPHACYEQPQAILHVLCADEPNHADCQFQQAVSSASSSLLRQTRSSHSQFYYFIILILFIYWTLLK